MYDKVIDPIDVVKKKGQRQVIMALMPRATESYSVVSLALMTSVWHLGCWS